MIRRAWEIVAPGRGRVVQEELGEPAPDEVIVSSEAGAVSRGSEALVFAGASADEAGAADGIAALQGAGTYPRRYGYTLVGRVSRVGAALDRADWHQRRVFVFHPHADACRVAAGDTIPVPEEVSADRATLYPNLETALTLVWDLAPLPGERVVVFGLGLVGLLTALLLAHNGMQPDVVEPDAARRESAAALLGSLGVRVLAAPAAPQLGVAHRGYGGYDAAVEVTGSPAVLDQAIGAVGFAGRIVVGSWYGARRHAVDLGGRFHRARQSLIASQVSHIPAQLSARFDRARRTALVWQLAQTLPLADLPRRDLQLEELNQVLAPDAAALPQWLCVRYP